MPDRTTPDEDPPIYGVVTAVVTSLEDPEGLGRVELKFDWLGELASNWARVMTPMAGNGRGMFFMPEVDDEVLVLFEDGDFDRPYVIGGLWNSEDKAPLTIKEGKNDVRQITSRTGHTITFDDTDKARKAGLKSSSGHAISLDDTDQAAKVIIGSKAGHTITLDDAAGKESLVIKSRSGHTITLDDSSGKESLVIKDKGGLHTITLDSAGAITIKSGQDLKIDASGSVIIKGGTKGAARQDDQTLSNAKADPAFWTWVKALTTHTHPTTAPGSPTGPAVVTAPEPSECKGAISMASGTVKIGD